MIKSVDQLQDRLSKLSGFLDSIGASAPAKEFREVCTFLQPHRAKTLEQLVNPPPKDGIAVVVMNLYQRAGSPGLTTEEIDAVFGSTELRKLGKNEIKSLAKALNVPAGNLTKDALISKMKINVKNRAETHGRVNN